LIVVMCAENRSMELVRYKTDDGYE
jgi:hypothetical protein